MGASGTPNVHVPQSDGRSVPAQAAAELSAPAGADEPDAAMGDSARDTISQLIAIQEASTRHIARELHDSFSQELAAIGMEIDLLADRPPQSRAQLRDRLGSVGQRIARLSDACHRISHRLHPSVINDLGLRVALQEECKALAERHSLEVDFRSQNLPHDLAPDIAFCLYRVAQESLRNVAKHAGAKRVRVRLEADEHQVFLAVQDEGRGFDTRRRNGGLGLISMAERVRQVNGRLTIQSKPSEGTRIEVVAPLVREA